MGMVNKYTFLLLTASAALFFGCSKEQEEAVEERHYSDYFTAEITPYGDDEKTYIEAGGSLDYSCWADEDAVNINGIVRAVDVNTTDANYSATIGADGIETVNGGFLAAYPGNAVSVSNNTATFTLPATTEYATVGSGAGTGAQVVEAPMVAYTTARSLQFENVGLLTLFNLNIEGSGQIALQRITISCDQPLSGSYSLTRQGDGWQRNATGLEGTSRALVCNSPVTLNTTAKPFYLYLPPVAGASTFTVDVQLTINGVRRHFTKTKTGTLNLVASKCYDFGTLTYHVASGTLTDHNSIEYTEKEPAGTEEDPYRISNASEWYYWCGKYAATSGKHFLLEDDIIVTSSVAEFQGILNGNGHSVTLSNCSLFAYLNGGTVKNTITTGTVLNEQFIDNNNIYYSGGIAAYATNARVFNCINTAPIIVNAVAITKMHIGGIVGCAETTTIEKCRNEANINTENLPLVLFNAGGIAGTISGSAENELTIINCCNIGNLNIKGKSDSNVGGALGRATNFVNVVNCYSRGSVTSTGTNTGGFVGSSKASIISCYFHGTASYFCYSNGKTIQYCYHSCNYTVQHNTSSGVNPTTCLTLSNATTITGGTSLSGQLNQNIINLPISGASTWSAYNGVTVLDWELE